MTLLTIIQTACDRVGVPRTQSVVSSADTTIRQMLALANQEGKELAKRATWQALTQEKTFTATATETQSGAIPTDFDRFIADSFYNRTQKRKVKGPLGSQEWQTQKALTAVVLFDAFRIRGSSLLMLPVPDAGDSYAFEYVSKYWVDTDGDGTADASAWVADTDTTVLDEDLMILGIKWRFLKDKGLDWKPSNAEYEAQVQQAISRDGAKTAVNFAEEPPYGMPSTLGIPEGSWSIT